MPELTPNIAEEFSPAALLAGAVERDVPPMPEELDDALPPPMEAAAGLAELPPPPTGLMTPAAPGLPPGQPRELPPPPGGAQVRMAAPGEIELEEEPTPELTAVQRAESAALDTAGKLDAQAEQRARLAGRRKELIEQYALTTDADERADLEKRLGALTEAERGVRESQAATRSELEESSAMLQAQVGAEQQLLQREAVDEIGQRRQEVQADAEAARTRREAEAADLQTQLQEDREALRAELQAGPRSEAVGQTVVELVGETLRATLRKEVPNYGPIMARARKRSEAAYKSRAQARMQQIGLTGDAIKDSQRLRDEENAQAKAGDAAMLLEVEAKLQQRLETAVQPLERMRLATTLESVRSERAAREAQALAARQEADRRRTKEDADLALVRARAAKEVALGTKAEAEAIKAARRSVGGGRGRPGGTMPGELKSAIQSGALSKKDAAMVFKQGVIDPATGEYMRRADGSFAVATSPKGATDLNEAIAVTKTANGLVNEALAMRGEAGWEPTSKFYSSDAGKRMAALSTQLLLLNKDVYQLGALSEADEGLLKRIQGGDLEGMQDPRPALRDMQRRAQGALNTRLRSLVPGAQPLSFERVESAPKPTAKSLRTRLSQAPRRDSKKIVPTARERASALAQMRDVAIADAGGNVVAGAKAFQKELPGLVKRAEADLAKLQAEAEQERPADVEAAEQETARAARRLVALEADEGASGEDVRAAEAAFQQAKAAQAKLGTPRGKALNTAVSEQEEYLFDLRRRLRSGAEAITKSKQVHRKRKERAEAAPDVYDL